MVFDNYPVVQKLLSLYNPDDSWPMSTVTGLNTSIGLEVSVPVF